jgi:ABC-2 type transport system permease protein
MLNYYEQKKARKKENKKGKGIFNKVILKQQFMENYKSLLTMTLIVASLMVLVLVLYPVVEAMFEGLDPELIEMLSLFGGVPENIAEFFAVEAGQIYVLVGAVYAAILGVNLIRKEVASGSSEFLYSQPIKKSTIFRSKLMVLIINLLIFNILITGISLATIYIVQGEFAFNVLYFLQYSLAALLIHLQTGILLFAITAIFKKSATIGLGIGYAVFSYFIAFIAQIASEVEFLKHITPFSYIFTTNANNEGTSLIRDGFSVINTPTLIGISVVVIAALIYSHRYFRKNDIV